MANEVYLIDIPSHEIAFIKDVCMKASEEVYGNTDVVFETVEKSRANICIKMKKSLQETFMIVVSQGVLEDLNLSSKEDNIIYSYEDSGKFLNEVTDMFGFKYEEELPELKMKKDESELDIIEVGGSTLDNTNETMALEIPVSSVLNTDTTEYLRSRNSTLTEENSSLRKEIERLRNRSKQDSIALSISEEAELTICKAKLDEKDKIIEKMQQDEIIQKKALEEAILKRKEAEKDCVKYKNSCADLTKDKTNLMNRVEMLTTSNQELNGELSSANKRCVELQEENVKNIENIEEKHKKEIYSYLSDLSDMKIKKENFETENNQLKIDVANKNSECERLKKDSEELERVSTELRLLKADKITLEADIKEKISECERLQLDSDKLVSINSELSSLKLKHEELKTKYDTSCKSESNLKSDLEKVKSELEMMKKDNLSGLDEKNSLLVENRRKEDEIKKLNGRLKELIESTKNSGGLESIIEELRERVARLEVEKAELSTTINMHSESAVSRISEALGVNDYYEIDFISDQDSIDNLRVVYTGSSESASNVTEFIKGIINNTSKETVILDFTCDTDIDACYKPRSGFSPLYSYLDGLLDINKCIDLESKEPVKYTKLSRGYINESYILNMDWGKLLSWVKEYNGNVIINMGVLSSIKLATLRNLCKVCQVDIVLKVTPANVRSAISFMHKVPRSSNIRYDCFTVSNDEGQNNRLLSRLNQEHKIIK